MWSYSFLKSKRCHQKLDQKNNSSLMTNSWRWLHLSWRATSNFTKTRSAKSNPKEITYRWTVIWSNNSTIILNYKYKKYIQISSIRRQRVKICKPITILRWKCFCKNWNCFNTNNRRPIWIFRRMESRLKSRRISTTRIGWRIWRRKSKT
jgi:hypothetical protein